MYPQWAILIVENTVLICNITNRNEIARLVLEFLHYNDSHAVENKTLFLMQSCIMHAIRMQEKYY